MKSTFSERFCNFLSTHPKAHKVVVVYNLVDKAIKFSHKKSHKNNLNLAKKFLMSNQYPVKFLTFILKNALKP